MLVWPWYSWRAVCKMNQSLYLWIKKKILKLYCKWYQQILSPNDSVYNLLLCELAYFARNHQWMGFGFSVIYLQTYFCINNIEIPSEAPGWRRGVSNNICPSSASSNICCEPSIAFYQVCVLGYGQETRFAEEVGFGGLCSQSGCHLAALHSAYTWLPGPRSAVTKASQWLDTHMESFCGVTAPI